jgi:hypothetical protein
MIRKIRRFLCLGVAASLPLAAKSPTFRELPVTAVAQMNRQRAFVADLARQHGLKMPTSTSTDYDLIQEIVSKKLIGREETWKLQALGVVFGDALVAEEPKLRWMEVTDEWGTDPTLLVGNTTYQLNALTMISKRVEAGEEQPFVHSLARTILDEARKVAPKADKRR